MPSSRHLTAIAIESPLAGEADLDVEEDCDGVDEDSSTLMAILRSRSTARKTLPSALEASSSGLRLELEAVLVEGVTEEG